MGMKRSTKARIALVFSGACILSVTAFLAVTASMLHKGADLDPAPMEGAARGIEAETQQGVAVAVDWEYWQSVNPDIIGWVTVPGTSIDYPIVQAPASDPDYYLTHDVYGDVNWVGCPYLDASCEGRLFGGGNAVVFGHNPGQGGVMFADFARYSDAGFAREHAEIVLQTPQETRVLAVQATDVIAGWEPLKRTSFEGEADFRLWYSERFDAAAVKLADDAAASSLVTFCTCSYLFNPDNERTIVYCAADAQETGGESAFDK